MEVGTAAGPDGVGALRRVRRRGDIVRLVTVEADGVEPDAMERLASEVIA